MYSWIENQEVERQVGIGKLAGIGNLKIKVHYDLIVFQEVHIYKTRDFKEEVEGPKTIKGTVAILEKDADLNRSARFTLELQNGRKIELVILRCINIESRRYEVATVSSLCWIQ